MKGRFVARVLVIALGLSGCVSDEMSEVVGTPMTNVPIEYKTIEPPEDGWTIEDINEVLYINGRKVSLPFTLEDIGWDKELIDVEYNEEQDTITGYLIKNENSESGVGISVKGNGKKTIDEKTEIYFIMIDTIVSENGLSNKELNNFVTFNGLSLGDKCTDDDLISAFGYYGDEDSSNTSLNPDFSYNLASELDSFYVSQRDDTFCTVWILLRSRL